MLSLVSVSGSDGFLTVTAKELAAGDYYTSNGQAVFTYDMTTGVQTLLPGVARSYNDNGMLVGSTTIQGKAVGCVAICSASEQPCTQ